MKRLILLFTLSLVGMAGVGCEKSSEPLPEDICWVIVNTALGEETLLLAQRAGSDYKKFPQLLTDFQTTYGVENIKYTATTPALPVKRNKTAYCYEISATVEFKGNYHPPVEALSAYDWWHLVKYIDEQTVTGKIYRWRYTEEDVKEEIAHRNKQYIDWEQGKIISSSYKNLGTYVENMPIEF